VRTLPQSDRSRIGSSVERPRDELSERALVAYRGFQQL